MKFKIFFLAVLMAALSPIYARAQSQNPPPPDDNDHLIYNEDTDSGIITDDEKQAQPPAAGTNESSKEINAKTAAKIKAEEEEKLRAPHDHYRVVPAYRYDKPPALKKVLKNGTKVYATTPSPQHYSGGFTVTPLSLPNLQGDIAGITFASIYPDAKPLMVGFNAEWQFFQGAGKMGLQGGLGFFSATGNGRFLHNSTTVSDATFTLYVIPVSATLLYHAQFWDRQPIVPFAGAGADYFGMLESRDDKDSLAQKVRYGGGAAWHWVAGAQIQLDFLDKEVIWQLDQDYGINHVYLTAEVRQIVGLNPVRDFSSFSYEGGVLFEF